MRIIAGRFKGRRLAGPEGPGVRPTSDSLRETLFNILGASVEDANVLDGFAGTGALGLEALSRGARHVVFVESDRRALKVLRQNIALCGAGNLCEVVPREFFLTLHHWMDREQPSLVLLDPPYDEQDLAAIVRVAAEVTAPGGRIVLEHSRRRDSPEQIEPQPLHRRRLVIAGDSALSFYQ